MLIKTTRGLLVVLALAASIGCKPATTSSDGSQSGFDPGTRNGKPTVYVVNYPLEYFSSRIGGDLIVVKFPVPPDEDPAFWKPDDAAVAQFQKADLILLNGAGYAKWTQQFSLPDARLVDTSQSFVDKLIHIDVGVVHSHGPGGEHSHQGVAFTTWVDPQLAQKQAEQIHGALVRLLPAHQTALDTNYRQLITELAQLDRQFELLAARYQGEPLFASHPVYQYLARRCGWNMKSLHWEPDEVPNDQEWAAFSKLLASHKSKWMIWEATPNRETADKLASLGVASIVFDPCGNRSEGGYLEAMTGNIQRLLTVFPE